MIKYAIIEVGCIECGEESAFTALLDEPPEGADLIQPGGEWDGRRLAALVIEVGL